MSIKNYIITAGDKKFFSCLLQLIYSIEKHKENLNSKLIYYDLGLTDEQRKKLEKKEKNVNWLEIRFFDFTKYPSFFNPKNENYAWKPTLIHEVFNEKKGNILYMDSANIILRNLKPIWDEITLKGTYVPLAGTGKLSDWTLSQSLEYLNVPKELYDVRNRAGNTCGFSYFNDSVTKIIERWKNLAEIEECIAPPGYNRYNHKSDQSILTVLLNEVEKRGGIQLTDDEVNISTSRPNKFISVRNKITNDSIIPIGFWSYHYFGLVRLIDILSNKLIGN